MNACDPLYPEVHAHTHIRERVRFKRDESVFVCNSGQKRVLIEVRTLRSDNRIFSLCRIRFHFISV